MGTPGAATVEMVVADPAITVRPEKAAYSFDEDDDAASVTFVARTASGPPRPSTGFSVTVSTKPRSDGARSPDDYAPLSETITFASDDFTASGSEWEARKEVALTLVDDGRDEGDESFDLELEGSAGLPARIGLRRADGSACPDEGCLVPVTIHDNDGPAAPDSRDELRLVSVPVVLDGVDDDGDGNDDVVTEPRSGRLEVFFRGQWGTVCDDRFTRSFVDPNSGSSVPVDNIAPQLACRLMGYETGTVVRLASSDDAAPAGQPIWLDDVRCAEGSTHWTGSPPTGLHHCYHAGVGRHNCTREQDVHLMCTGSAGETAMQAQGQALSGPVAIGVADAEVKEAAAAALAFRVTLDRASLDPVTVDYATEDRTATAGEDYTAVSGTLTLAAGETEKIVEVPVLDDVHDEGAETLVLKLSNAVGARIADGEATGTIKNTDPMPQAWLARFGRTVADQVIDAVESRMRAPHAPGAEVSLAGQRLGLGALFGAEAAPDGEAAAALRAREAEAETAEAERRLTAWRSGATDDEERSRLRTRTVTQRELLLGSSFSLTAEAGDGSSGTASLWGRGAVSRFDGREGTLSLDGEVASVMVGVDWARPDWSAGLIAARSAGEGGYAGHSKGRVKATVTGLYPWGRLALTERVDAWGAAGYGTGELTVTPKKPGVDEDGTAIRTDLDLRMAAAGLRGVLVDGGGDGPTLTGKADALIVQTASDGARGPDGGSLAAASASVSRLRLGVEAERPLQLGDGGTLTPSVKIGLRRDGGDAETGFGVDIGGGIAWSLPAHDLELELRGRGLLTHEAEGFRERGFSGSLAWDPQPSSAQGPALTLTQTVGGSASGGADALLVRGTLAGLAAQPDSASGDDDDLQHRRLEARFGYGFPALGGRFASVPEIGLGLSDTGREYILGWRLAGEGPGALQLSAEARRYETDGGGGAEHRIGARLSTRW